MSRLSDSGRRVAWAYLAAEFVVIVVGVLVALGVDSAADWVQDRQLEREYLERLKEDVDYDLGEIAFTESIAEASEAYLDSLATPSWMAVQDDATLVAALMIAAESRQPDLSKSTFNELVSSGRLGLIRSREVRTTMAAYYRENDEYAGFFDQMRAEAATWIRHHVPFRVIEAYRAACPKPAGSDFPNRACRFDTGGWAPGPVAKTLRSPTEVQPMLAYQSSRTAGTLFVTRALRERAREITRLLDDELK